MALSLSSPVAVASLMTWSSRRATSSDLREAIGGGPGNSRGGRHQSLVSSPSSSLYRDEEVTYEPWTVSINRGGVALSRLATVTGASDVPVRTKVIVPSARTVPVTSMTLSVPGSIHSM